MARQERLEQLEQQLRDIEARWSAREQVQPQTQEDVLPASPQAPIEPPVSQGECSCKLALP